MSTSSSLIQLPAPWSGASARSLAEEGQSCFNEIDHTTSVVNLVSVGGLDCQDLPMSGTLLEKPCLKKLPYIRFLLTCIRPTLGRACLVQLSPSHPLVATPFYQNSAYTLFYQTIAISIDIHVSLIIETKCAQHSTSDLYDKKRLSATEKITLDDSGKQSLNLARPALDVLTPEQTKGFLATILTACKKTQTTEQHEELTRAVESFIARWSNLHSSFGTNHHGEWSYQSALNEFRQSIIPTVRPTLTSMEEQTRSDVEATLQIINSQLQMCPIPPQRINRKLLIKAKSRKHFKASQIEDTAIFDRPIFIVSAPRAGSTLLFETLSQFPDIWSTGEENHKSLESISGLHPKHHAYKSNRLEASCLTATISDDVKKMFVGKLHDRNQQYYLDTSKDNRPKAIRFLEKTPKNALRIPFLKALFPDALFIYLKRDHNSNVSSLIDGWRSQQFISYKNIPGFETRHWKFLLTPGWQSLHDCSIATIAHQQWQQSNRIIQQDLAALPARSWMSIDYQELIGQPETIVRQFSEFADLRWDPVIQARCQHGLPVSRLTLSSPHTNKWKKHACFFG